MSLTPNDDAPLLGLSTFTNDPKKNACFLNTSLQCLYHIVPLSNELLKIRTDSSFFTTSKQAQLVQSYLMLMETYWEENCCISPDTFFSLFAETFPGYEPGSQNDAYEALTFIIDQLHEVLAVPKQEQTPSNLGARLPGASNLGSSPAPSNLGSSPAPGDLGTHPTPSSKQDQLSVLDTAYKARFTEKKLEYLRRKSVKQLNLYYRKSFPTYPEKVPGTSPIIDYLIGQEHQRIQCQHCRQLSHQFFAYNHVALSLFPDKNTLDDLFEAYCNRERYDEENQPTCDHCGKKNKAVRKTIFWSLPQYLIVVLKRFSQSASGQFIKNRTPISFPIENLDLQKHLSRPNELPRALYNLHSIGIHQEISLRGPTAIGNSYYCGHYWAAVRGLDGNFYGYDDDRDVFPLSYERINKLQSAAYFLIYERQ